MARKANISREEIIEACWVLLDQHRYPNIPRVAEYFEALDGRRGSNTTLQNAISEWEEAYREHQQNELKEYADYLQPAIDRFKRDTLQVMMTVVDEHLAQTSQQQSLKTQAIEGRYDSLTEALLAAESENTELKTKLAQLENQLSEVGAQNHTLTEKLQYTASRNQLLERELGESQQSHKELLHSYHQQQVELAKQDIQLQQLRQNNEQLVGTLAERESYISQLHKEYASSSAMQQKLDEIVSKMQALEHAEVHGKKR